MNSETKTKKCPFCRYLITSDRISCAYCGTISPTLWNERITDDWEKEESDYDLILRLIRVSNEYGGENYTYRDLYKAASDQDKVFISKVAIETHQHDLGIFFDTFIELKNTYDFHGSKRDVATPTLKDGCKLFVFKIGDLYRYVGHDNGTITLFEISTGLHEQVLKKIDETIAETQQFHRKRQDEYEKERKEKEQAIGDAHEKSLAEYNALPFWKRKITKKPELQKRRW